MYLYSSQSNICIYDKIILYKNTKIWYNKFMERRRLFRHSQKGVLFMDLNLIVNLIILIIILEIVKAIKK